MRRKLLILLLFAGIAIIISSCGLDGFSGNRIANPDSYTLDIERMNGSDLHALELKAGDILEIHFETEKGSLRMEISSPDGGVLYSGNGKKATEFTISVPEDGVYSIHVEAKNAIGKIHVQLKEKA